MKDSKRFILKRLGVFDLPWGAARDPPQAPQRGARSAPPVAGLGGGLGEELKAENRSVPAIPIE